MRFHSPKRRQRASTSTWPPWAVAWLELVNWRCSLVFRFVNAAIVLHHHNGDVVSTDFSPIYAFFFTRLTIGVMAGGCGGARTFQSAATCEYPTAPNNSLASFRSTLLRTGKSALRPLTGHARRDFSVAEPLPGTSPGAKEISSSTP